MAEPGPKATKGSITELIQDANAGDPQAVNRLFTALYGELHTLARAQLRRNAPITVLDTTSLLHESYLRLVKLGTLSISNRAHFLGYASRTMRSIIVDFARQRIAEKRGGGISDLPLDTDIAQSTSSGEQEIVRVHDALEELAAVDERLVRVVEMRYFGGLSEEEIAQALGITSRTVRATGKKRGCPCRSRSDRASRGVFGHRS